MTPAVVAGQRASADSSGAAAGRSTVRNFLASNHCEGEPVHLQAQVDIVGMNTLESASHSVGKVGGCPGSPRTVEIRGHFGIASGEMPTDVFSAGQVLSGLAI